MPPPSSSSGVGGGGVDEAKLHGILERVWGYRSFRPPQDSVIRAALEGRDTLVVMATGGGKSICFQAAALAMGRPVFVVSPLISLMHDQVGALTARGVDAAFLGSAQSSADVKARAWAGDVPIVYVTPELVTNAADSLRALHETRGIGMIAVDEAHW